MTKNIYTRFGLSVISSLMLLSGALAADMSRLPAMRKAPVIEDEPIPGLYLRGDIGTTSYANPSVDYNNLTAGTVNPLTGASIARATMGGIGIGLKTGFLRVDTTIDYRGQAAYKDATPCWTAGCGANTVANTARVDTLSLMLNGYLDLGTWYSLTPYIGAGAGLGMVTLRDFQAMSFTGAGVQTITNMGSQSRQNIAFSLMAGTAYSINKNLAIDIGYRYLNLGQGWTKATVQAGAASPAEQWTTGRITAHELRAGIRYTLD